MKAITSILILAVVFVLNGCASLPKCGDVAVADESAGRMIVYRQKALFGFAATQSVGVDQCKLGSLRNGSFLVGTFAAGAHEVSVLSEFGNPQDPHTVVVNNGSDTFIRWSSTTEDVVIVGDMGIATGHNVFTEVSRETAIAELEKLQQLE